ncbi:hypothetical protein BKA62DRAFT_702838 [Auriculariales sp. MPI-PUGE-AT-0066]|nr:hypothetical protein BKA62DRAFT_702838 [Auriculariales sp. MPI-PUGE-AT-0066]
MSLSLKLLARASVRSCRPALRVIPTFSCRWMSFKVLGTFEEPSRAGLWYHCLQPDSAASVFAVSLLADPPKSLASPTVVGYLPANKAEDIKSEATFNDFRPNNAFHRLLELSIRDALQRGLDDGLAVQARLVHDGWIHINDDRNVAAKTGDRIGDPDDIVGTVCVQDGKIVPSTFETLPTYRLCTQDGIVQLSDPLMRNLVQTLQATHDSEID